MNKSEYVLKGYTYELMGNAVSVPVVKALGLNLKPHLVNE